MAKHELTPPDLVWNRACESFSEEPLRTGDLALRDLIRAHGLICNGGVFHAFDCLTAPQLEAAMSGYRFFGLDQAAKLLLQARKLPDETDEVGDYEAAMDAEYAKYIPDDSELGDRFRRHFAAKPSDFAPLAPEST